MKRLKAIFELIIITFFTSRTRESVIKETPLMSPDVLNDALMQGVVRLTFQKVSGIVTTRLATWKLDLMPEYHRPKGGSSVANIMPFYDITKGGWSAISLLRGKVIGWEFVGTEMIEGYE